MHHLAKNLKLLRSNKGRSGEEVATALGIKRTSLSGYENGYHEPDLKTLMLLGDYYRVTLHDLVRTDLDALPKYKLAELQRAYQA